MSEELDGKRTEEHQVTLRLWPHFKLIVTRKSTDCKGYEAPPVVENVLKVLCLGCKGCGSFVVDVLWSIVVCEILKPSIFFVHDSVPSACESRDVKLLKIMLFLDYKFFKAISVVCILKLATLSMTIKYKM